MSKHTLVTANRSKTGLKKLLPAKEYKKPPKTSDKGLNGLTAEEAHNMNIDHKLDKAEHHAKYEWPKKQTQTETPIERAKTDQSFELLQ